MEATPESTRAPRARSRGRRTRRATLASLALAALVAGSVQATAVAAPQPEADGQVVTANVYVHAQVGDPWDSADTDDAMNAVFGTDAWEEEHFETVDTGTGPGGLFASSVRFIFLNGSDDGTIALEAFLAANEPALQSWVAAGGHLFLNNAPNEGDGTVDYDGRQIFEESSQNVVAADPAHPIFNGPFTPAGPTYNGGSYAHSLVSGPGLTPLLLRTVGGGDGAPGDPNAIVLAEYVSGSGLVLLGGITLPEHQGPEPNAANLWANIIAYASTVPPAPAAPPVVVPPAPIAAPAADTTSPRAGIRNMPDSCVTGAFRIRVTVADAAGVSRTIVRRDDRRIARRVFTNTTRASFVVRVDAAGLRSGRHTIGVVARDSAGNRRVVRRAFRRCARPAQQVEPRRVDLNLTG